MLFIRTTVIALLLTGSGTLLGAQVIASRPEALKGTDVEVFSPLQLDVAFGASTGRASLVNHQERPPIVSADTRNDARDRARVTAIQVWRETERGGHVRVVVVPSISTEWARQDLNVRVALLTPEGKEVGHKDYQHLTVWGKHNWAARMGAVWDARPKNAEAEFVLTREELAAMFTEGRSPSVRVRVEVVP